MAFRYLAPTSLDEALDLAAEHGTDATFLAGGTSVVLLLKSGLIAPDLVVNLAGIEALRGIHVNGSLRIGPLTSIHALERSPELRAAAPAVTRAVSQVATVRIRNQATIGGNLVHADPAQDPPPALLVHDAEVTLASRRGTRTVPLHAFFSDVFETVLEPDELLTELRIPALPAGARTTYRAFLPRTVDDYATVAVAARLDLAGDRIVDARIALGAVGPTPIRATAAEAALRGAGVGSVDLEAVAALADEVADPVEDGRGSVAYKRRMLRVHVVRALRELLAGDPGHAGDPGNPGGPGGRDGR